MKPKKKLKLLITSQTLILLLLWSCTKESPPSIETTEVTNVTFTTATCGGNITDDGGSEITERGVCWSTNTNPTTDDFKATSGNGFGSFTAELTNLTPGTTYYVKAYGMRKGASTGYGNEVSFSVPNKVYDIDGNVYTEVIIGTQVWMLENLKVTHYRNGDIIPNVTDETTWSSLTSGALCDYNNNPANSAIYGKLYNGYAINDSRNIAPEGWRVPTSADFNTLLNYVSNNQLQLIETGNVHWQGNSFATNISGFTALPGGIREPPFYGLQNTAYFFSSTTDLPSSNFFIELSPSSVWLHSYINGNKIGCSVRCIKN